VREDVADLAALIEGLGLAPAWVAGSSFGASIALRLAGERSDLLRGVIAHEPPLLADDPATAPLLAEVAPRVEAVVERIAAGDPARAAELFVDTVALGPGTWAELDPDLRRTCIENAHTFLDEARDPEQLVIDLASLRTFRGPTLLTTGDRSSPVFPPVIRRLAREMPVAEVVTFAGSGHIPHVTHPEIYADTITAFIHRHAGSRGLA
jgi:pimeloyl-ACP methyl ester carboxylesterase